jgi:hypothetical protein
MSGVTARSGGSTRARRDEGLRLAPKTGSPSQLGCPKRTPLDPLPAFPDRVTACLFPQVADQGLQTVRPTATRSSAMKLAVMVRYGVPVPSPSSKRRVYRRTCLRSARVVLQPALLRADGSRHRVLMARGVVRCAGQLGAARATLASAQRREQRPRARGGRTSRK